MNVLAFYAEFEKIYIRFPLAKPLNVQTPFDYILFGFTAILKESGYTDSTIHTQYDWKKYESPFDNGFFPLNFTFYKDIYGNLSIRLGIFGERRRTARNGADMTAASTVVPRNGWVTLTIYLP
jgi:hypothetical protein